MVSFAALALHPCVRVGVSRISLWQSHDATKQNTSSSKRYVGNLARLCQLNMLASSSLTRGVVSEQLALVSAPENEWILIDVQGSESADDVVAL